MSDELTTFLNFKFEKRQVMMNVADERGVDQAPRWQLNWREYAAGLAALGIDASRDSRPSLMRYWQPMPDSAVFDDLVMFQTVLRQDLAKVAKSKRLPFAFFQRIFNETDGVIVKYVLDPEKRADLTPDNLGDLSLGVYFDALTYRIYMMAILRERVVSKTIFELEVGDDGLFRDRGDEIAASAGAVPGPAEAIDESGVPEAVIFMEPAAPPAPQPRRKARAARPPGPSLLDGLTTPNGAPGRPDTDPPEPGPAGPGGGPPSGPGGFGQGPSEGAAAALRAEAATPSPSFDPRECFPDPSALAGPEISDEALSAAASLEIGPVLDGLELSADSGSAGGPSDAQDHPVTAGAEDPEAAELPEVFSVDGAALAGSSALRGRLPADAGEAAASPSMTGEADSEISSRALADEDPTLLADEDPTLLADEDPTPLAGRPDEPSEAAPPLAGAPPAEAGPGPAVFDVDAMPATGLLETPSEGAPARPGSALAPGLAGASSEDPDEIMEPVTGWLKAPTEAAGAQAGPVSAAESAEADEDGIVGAVFLDEEWPSEAGPLEASPPMDVAAPAAPGQAALGADSPGDRLGRPDEAAAPPDGDGASPHVAAVEQTLEALRLALAAPVGGDGEPAAEAEPSPPPDCGDQAGPAGTAEFQGADAMGADIREEAIRASQDGPAGSAEPPLQARAAEMAGDWADDDLEAVLDGGGLGDADLDLDDSAEQVLELTDQVLELTDLAEDGPAGLEAGGGMVDLVEVARPADEQGELDEALAAELAEAAPPTPASLEEALARPTSSEADYEAPPESEDVMEEEFEEEEIDFVAVEFQLATLEHRIYRRLEERSASLGEVAYRPRRLSGL